MKVYNKKKSDTISLIVFALVIFIFLFAENAIDKLMKLIYEI